MKPDHGIPPATLDQINSVFARFPEVERAVLFGSRAKGNHKPGSDIDLALYGADLNWCLVGRIYDALDDLFLPYTFSLIEHNATTDPEVAAHIVRVGREIYPAAGAREKADARLKALWAKGGEAWADVPDGGAWVEKLRGGPYA